MSEESGVSGSTDHKAFRAKSGEALHGFYHHYVRNSENFSGAGE